MTPLVLRYRTNPITCVREWFWTHATSAPETVIRVVGPCTRAASTLAHAAAVIAGPAVVAVPQLAAWPVWGVPAEGHGLFAGEAPSVSPGTYLVAGGVPDGVYLPVQPVQPDTYPHELPLPAHQQPAAVRYPAPLALVPGELPPTVMLPPGADVPPDSPGRTPVDAPEPASLMLLAAGIVAAALARRA